jgi:hypothetical protein
MRVQGRTNQRMLFSYKQNARVNLCFYLIVFIKFTRIATEQLSLRRMGYLRNFSAYQLPNYRKYEDSIPHPLSYLRMQVSPWLTKSWFLRRFRHEAGMT